VNRRAQGRCPACGFESLFLGAGGYVTCSRAGCDRPAAATEALAHNPRLLVGAFLPDDDTLKQPAGYAPHRDHLVALPCDPVTITRTCIADPEEYARIFNAGYDEAVAQALADDPSLAQEWLNRKLADAFAEQAAELRRVDPYGGQWLADHAADLRAAAGGS
jgi:hypothetical protein